MIKGKRENLLDRNIFCMPDRKFFTSQEGRDNRTDFIPAKLSAGATNNTYASLSCRSPEPLMIDLYEFEASS